MKEGAPKFESAEERESSKNYENFRDALKKVYGHYFGFGLGERGESILPSDEVRSAERLLDSLDENYTLRVMHHDYRKFLPASEEYERAITEIASEYLGRLHKDDNFRKRFIKFLQGIR